MHTQQTIITYAKEVIASEAAAITNLENLVNEEFAEAVETLYKSKGRVIITGIGKSAIIATKIVATMNSTGTPAIFMHAADAIHGDLGAILKDDVVVCISKSGNTSEIKALVPFIKNFGNTLIAITGNKDSYLGQQADFMLNSYVEKEVCPNNLAPTTSTTAQLVIGDALAVCLLHLRGFSSKDFAKYHPGGALGKKLFLRIKDIIINNEKPQVDASANLNTVIMEMTKKRLGATAVIEDEKIVGIVTDGDLRRMMTNHQNYQNFTAREIMSKKPKIIDQEVLAVEAVDVMENNSISQLLAVNQGKYAGIVHIHDLVKEGIL